MTLPFAAYPFEFQACMSTWEELDKFKCLEANCREKTLEKSGLEPTVPNRLADWKHWAFSTQPNTHLQKIDGSLVNF